MNRNRRLQRLTELDINQINLAKSDLNRAMGKDVAVAAEDSLVGVAAVAQTEMV
jgi:hypothetical protein